MSDMTSGLAKLPDELVLNELESLSGKDIASLSSVNRHYRALYQDSDFLQYKVELEKAGCQDLALLGDTAISPYCLSCKACTDTKERLNHLKTREARWRDLDLRRNAVRVPLGFQLDYPCTYKLSAGLIFLINEENGLRYIDLKDLSRIQAPSEPSIVSGIPEAELRFHSIPVEGETIEIGLGLGEHDLIALLHIVANATDNQELKLTYIQLSTGEPHPLAKEKTINLFEAPSKEDSGNCEAWLEIVGQYLVVLITFPNSHLDIQFRDRLYVLDWTTGEIISHKTYPRWTLSGIGFITPTLFVTLNKKENALKLLQIMKKEDGEMALCFLQTLLLPKLDDNYSDMYCKGESNLLGNSPDCVAEYINEKRRLPTSRISKGVDFRSGHEIRSDPTAAIITLNFECFHYLSGMNWELALAVHRSYLAQLALDSLKMHTVKVDEPPSAGEGPSGFNFMLDSDGDLCHTTPGINWEDWGPENTRVSEGWSDMTAGQRQVRTRECGQEVVIRDFNPYSIYMEKMQTEQADAPSVLCSRRVVESSEAYPSMYMENPVDDTYSRLPYVEYVLKPSTEFIRNRVLIDDERLIIIHEAIDVFSMWP